MAQTMKKLWNDDAQQADLVKRGFGRVHDFSWDRMAKATLELYTKASYEKNWIHTALWFTHSHSQSL